MGAWRLLLGGLTVWAAHFFALYAVASIFESSMTARLLVGALTAVALAANAAILVLALRRPAGGAFSRWVRSLGLIGAGFSIVAVIWQGLPALIGV